MMIRSPSPCDVTRPHWINSSKPGDLRHWTRSSFVLVMVYLRFGTNQFPQLIVNWTFRNKLQWNIKGNMKCFVKDWFENIVSKCWPQMFRPQYMVRILCCLGRLHVELSYLGTCYICIDHLYVLVMFIQFRSTTKVIVVMIIKSSLIHQSIYHTNLLVSVHYH